MKKRTLILSLLLAVGAAATVVANDGPAMKVVSQKGSEIFKVIYKGADSGRVRLNIRDHQGKTIHTKHLGVRDGFILPVNFKGLQSGSYTIELVDNAGKYEQQISYLPSSSTKTIHVSKLANESSKYLVAVADGGNETIDINIYDQNNKLVHSESKRLSGDFAQVYTIQNSSRGRYTFEVADSAGNRKYFDF